MDKFIHPKYPILSWLRIIGNAFFIFGYAIILFADVKFGIYCRFLGNILSWPYFQKVKMWDMIFIRSFFAIIELAKLVQLFLF